ncbi:MAG: TolC family protein, partial [Nonlabens sp.]
MKYRIIRYIIPVTLTLFLFNSCGVVNNKYYTPDINFSENYRDNETQDTISMAAVHWKEIISDSILQKLIEEGLQNNLDLKTALENINQAKASLTQAKLSFLPSLEGSAQVSKSKTSEA